MPNRATTTLLATTALSLGIAAPAAAQGPPAGTIGSECLAGRTALFVHGQLVATLPGTCDAAHGRKWSNIEL